MQLLIEPGFLDQDKPIREYTEAERHDFLYKEPTKVPVGGANMTYEALVPKIRKSMLSKYPAALQPDIHAIVDRADRFITCQACVGTRRNESGRTVRLDGITIT